MIEGPEHEKVWRTSHADGTTSYHSNRTAQPSVHELYMQWMNITELHNKLRQGVTSMADVWGDTLVGRETLCGGAGILGSQRLQGVGSLLSTDSGSCSRMMHFARVLRGRS
eukprot:5763481-Pleurochrysis_carterae.AAC.1